jgi:hypothetical protein
MATCIFAHSAEELRPRMCPHGDRCRFDRRNSRFDSTRRPCGFFHPGERITDAELFKRATEFSVAKPMPMPGTTIKTKLCPSWSTGCFIRDCPNAHSKAELSPEMCKHGALCRFNPKRPDFDQARRPCHLFHPGDTKEEVFARALHKLEIKQRQTEKIPQFVVKVNDEKEEEAEEDG